MKVFGQSMGVGARRVVLPDWLSWNRRLPRFGAHGCSSVAIVLSTLAVLAICFVYFDVAVAPTSLLLQGQAVFYGVEPAPVKETAASGRVAPSEAKQSGDVPYAVDEPRIASAPSPSVVVTFGLDEPQSTPSPSPIPFSGAQNLDLLSLAPEPHSSGHTGATEAGQPVETAGDPLLLPSPGCDFYSGRWVRDNTSYPLYRVQDCPFADDGFRCQDHERPDREYEKWRWQPDECDLPRFQPEQLLERLRDSRLVFVGDSLGRNQWESMLCLLASGVSNKSRIYEVEGNPITKHKGYLRFRFEDCNCSVEYYRSPYLVSHGRAPAEHPKQVKSTLKLDKMDSTSSKWLGADVLVFNAGHWWTNSKTIQTGIFFQEGQEVNMTMDIQEACTRSLRTWSSWIKSNVDPQRTRVFFRSFASVHFRGGTWNRGGQCHLETQPFGTEESFGGVWSNDVIVRELANLKHVTYLNITRLTDYRKDAHPAIWGSYPPNPPNRQDCSHWCLPGVPDSWNEILIAELMKSRGGIS